MICMYSDVMLYLPSRDLLCHMNLISRHTARLIFLQKKISILLTCIAGSSSSIIHHICCLRSHGWNCFENSVENEWFTRGELKQYKADGISQFQCLIFHSFLQTLIVWLLCFDWRMCYWWVSWLSLDTPNRCQDIYLQQATNASSHIHSKSK